MGLGICNDHIFWDSSAAWSNNSWPELTECFRFTVLDPFACGWLWLSALVYLPYLSTLPRQPLFASTIFKAKVVCTLAIIFVHLISVVEESVSSRMWAHQLADAIWLATLILSIAVLLAELSRGLSRSMVHFAFWVFASLCLLVQVYSECMQESYETDTFHFIVMCIRYALATVLFILNSLSDYHLPREKNHNPELSASALAFISFAWLEKLMFRGSRFPLKIDDVYDLNPEDRTSSVIQKFLEKWNQFSKCGCDNNISPGQQQRSKSISTSKPKSDLGEEMHLIASHSFDTVSNGKRRGYIEALATANKTAGRTEEKVQPSFFMTLLRTFGFKIIFSQSGMIIFVWMNLLTPFLLGWLIEFAQDLCEPKWHGFVYALALLTSRMLMTVFNSTCQYLSARLALQVRSASIAAIFRKALVLSSESRRESALGEIVTLMSVDTNYLEMFLAQSFVIWMCLFTFFVAVYLLYTVIGVAMLAGLGFISLMLLINLSIANRMKAYQDKIMVIKDERLRMMGEILGGIKVIKLYGWEPIFIRSVKAIRARELKILLRYCVVDGIDTFAYTASTFWMTFFMFLTFVLVTSDHYLSAKTAFVTINYIALIRMSINKLPLIIRSLVKAGTSSVRINKFLQAKDLDPENLKRDTTDEFAIRIRNGDFAWGPDEPPVLTNINITIKPGQLVAVVGTVGAGKTSLLSALLGEMNRIRGYANLNSSVAYVPQQAWIQNNTVRENILFGKPLDLQHYKKVIEACALQPDFEALPAGDFTEIGEKGINLSGGQKQRVSVARAVYSNSDIILLDDPLSALDSHVGKHIFKQVIGKKGLLKDKTRLLVTHGLQWLPMVDYIIVLNQGHVTEAGTYRELISHDGPFANFLSQYLNSTNIASSPTEEPTDPDSSEDEIVRGAQLLSPVMKTSDGDTLSRTSSQRHRALTLPYDSGMPRGRKRPNETSGSFSIPIQAIDDKSLTDVTEEKIHKLITDEEHTEGKVGWNVYLLLLRAYGFKFFTVTSMFVMGFHTAYNLSYIWLTRWNDDRQLANFTEFPANSTGRYEQNRYYMETYAFLGMVQTLCCIIYSGILQFRHVTTSRIIHTQLLEGIMHAPMSFFDTVPIGRILNRFSQDLDVLDTDLFLEIEVVIEHAMFSVGIIIIISYTFPPFLGVLVLLIILFYIQQQFYVHTSCQLLRIASANRSPVYSHFSETLSGVSVIRAHRAQERFITDSDNRVDMFQKAMAASYAANKWILSRLDIISYVCILSATIFTIYYRGEVEPGLVGLSITFSLLITNELSSVTQMSGLFQTHVVSVERIHEYSTLDSEAPWALPSDSSTLQNWPSKGRIQFIDYSTRYRPGLDLVLNSVSFSIEAGEKIGVVGRTGAGKSSMVLSLFRLIEAVSGKIVIDGVDIAKVGLHALRQGLTILPQDPILFAGTLRMNLDPFKTKTDEELWQALEHAHLKAYIQSLPHGLDHDVGEGGENLSMGQKQLVCLARTLVRKTKIIVLDEATAAVDMETDELIQKTLKQECRECTVITIAHRINTVLDYDRIMVLQSGHVIEFASPSDLLRDLNSVFYSLAREAGVISTDTNESVV